MVATHDCWTPGVLRSCAARVTARRKDSRMRSRHVFPQSWRHAGTKTRHTTRQDEHDTAQLAQTALIGPACFGVSGGVRDVRSAASTSQGLPSPHESSRARGFWPRPPVAAGTRRAFRVPGPSSLPPQRGLDIARVGFRAGGQPLFDNGFVPGHGALSDPTRAGERAALHHGVNAAAAQTGAGLNLPAGGVHVMVAIPTSSEQRVLPRKDTHCGEECMARMHSHSCHGPERGLAEGENRSEERPEEELCPPLARRRAS